MPIIYADFRLDYKLATLPAGMLNKEIGAELGITLRTIKTHRARVMQKMGVLSVAELVRMTQKSGVAPAPYGPKGP